RKRELLSVVFCSFSSSSRGWHERRQQQQQQQQHNGCGCWSLLPRYTTLDAFTWGALAVLALQLAKQLQWLRSAPGTRGETGLWQLEKLLSVLPLHRHSVPRAAPTSHSRRHETPCFLLGADPDPVLENPHPGTSSQQGEYHPLPETDEFLFPSGQGSEPSPAQRSRQEKAEQQETLAKAASKVQEVFRTSVSVALNILGIEHMRDEHHEAAYSCFKTAADRGYSKAQFNVGLCYEHGRGIERDPAKAMLYYRRAAYQGHSMAQYRCAKWLLRHWPRADRDGAWEAVALLEQAATLGLTQAQAYLGVLYLKGLQPGKHRALKYLQLAAKNGSITFNSYGILL
uniref:DAP3 binding cell death enhancer 1 n=1 Tax=Sphenodon punctatus TaxID=8508 RepID=A0A8D0GAP9_SPHPU